MKATYFLLSLPIILAIILVVGGFTLIKQEDKYLHLEEGYSESACTTACLQKGQEIRERTYLGECYCQLKEGPK